MKSFLNLRLFPGAASPVSYPVHFAAPRLRRLLSVTRFEHENSATRERPASPSYTHPLSQLWLDTAEDHTDTGQPTGSNPVQEEYRAAIHVVSQEQGRPEFEILQQFQLLQVLLPDLTARIGSMAAIDIVRLSVDIVDIAEKVLLIRDALPAANVSRIVAGSPGLLYLSKDELQSNLQQVESLLAPHEPRWQTMITEAPFLAQATQLQATLKQIERTFDTRHTGAKPATLLGIMISMGLGGPKWPSLDASSDESDLLWL